MRIILSFADLDEMALYESGRLHVYYNLVEAGTFTLDQVADVMDMSTEELEATRHIWEGGEITARRDATMDLLLRDARRKMYTGGMEYENRI